MGKIAPISAKYIVHAEIQIEGVVEKPDVIGAIFGQTEGLLGTDLELRELQNSGRIGRIDANLDVKGGKTTGEIIIPSSMDKSETAIIAAALETIDRIGPCNSKIKVTAVEDVRVSKRQYLLDRAKFILKEMINKKIPDSLEISEEVKKSVRALEVEEWGPDRLAAGPGIKELEEIIVVEGRADVVNLLRNGFKNVIALNGTSVPKSLIPLTKQKTTTLFLDGDRGGDLILKGAFDVGMSVDFVARAPSGREVEELTQKEINQGLRAKIPVEQVSPPKVVPTTSTSTQTQRNVERQDTRKDTRRTTSSQKTYKRKVSLDSDRKEAFKKVLDEIIGSRAAAILDDNLSVLGKLPVGEISKTLQNFKGAEAVILDGEIPPKVLESAEKANVKYLVAKDSDLKSRRLKVVTEEDMKN